MRGRQWVTHQRRWMELLPAVPVGVFLLVCCLPVLGWMGWQVVSRPGMLAGVLSQQWRIVVATMAYNLLAAGVAVIIAVPAALVIGRGRTGFSITLGFAAAVGLLQPSIVYTYGWVQIFRIAELFPRPQSMLDILRCVLTLAGWLWPIPAVVLGLSLRRMDVQLQQQAMLDNALFRITARHLLGGVVASICIVMVLAMQEFSIYDYSGIQVVPTEVRAIFQSTTDPAVGAARALATALPTIVLLIVLALLGVRLVRTSAAGGETIEADRWPRGLDAGVIWYVLSVVVVALTIVTPTVALVVSMQRPFDLPALWGAFGPEVKGSIMLAAGAGAVAFVIALSASLVRLRGGLILSSLLFLVGGQMVAVALIRLYNRPSLGWIYNQWPIGILANLALFGWVALAGGRLTWSRSWQQLREISAVDGASRWQVGRYVVWPLAWPVCAAAAGLVAILSMAEVPAAVLLQVQRPPTIIPWLVTWVHMQRSDEMIQGSLLLLGLVMALSAVTLTLAYVATRRYDRHRLRRQRQRGEPISAVQMFSGLVGLMLILGGCEETPRPRAVWCDTGTGRGQVVYPRAIAYSSRDHTWFIVDRLARIQRLDQRGQPLNEWRMPEWEHGKPVGLTVGPDGNLWVPDTHYHRVMVYSPTGELVRQFGSFGKEPGQFVLPTDIAFDSTGHVFVSEYGDNDRIQVFDQQGNVLRQIGRFGQGDGEFARPQSMVIVDDTLYVTDACNHRIIVFKTDGTFVRNIGSVGTGLGQFRFPYGLDIDSRDRLVVCEFGNNRIQLIDPETGKGLETWGVAGREPGELAYPWGVAVGQDDQVVAVDAGNNRLQVFTF